MKKITFLLLCMVTSFYCQAQSPVQNPDLLLNKETPIAPLSLTLQEFGYESLNKSAETKITGKAFKRPAAIESNKVLEVSPYAEYGTTKFKVKLYSAEKGTYYYDYDPKYDNECNLAIVKDL